ncbi:FadR/GntR family transcriptional regulator [Yaniella halotolerans]|uniref:FadR/GntR family transcriptional regulator n=1 Tax=Yaniella halotolerans TaxID=225453 RepID=UPI0003B3EBFE|nr:FCD domain-containing protein [Yaniella halotolerans]
MSLPLVERETAASGVVPEVPPYPESRMHSHIPLVGEAASGVIPLGYEHSHAGQIATAISLGELAVGDRLPAESELADQFGVAIATIRKSLAELRDKGLVETHRGRSGGTFVIKVPFPTSNQVSQYLDGISIVNLRDFGDERVTISRGIVHLACQRAQAASLQALERAADRLLNAEDASAQASEYSRFHTQLAVAAQSPRLLRLQMRLLSEITSLLWSPGGAGMTPALVQRDHEVILEALAQRDVSNAQQSMERHVQDGIYRLIDAKLTLQNRPETE